MTTLKSRSHRVTIFFDDAEHTAASKLAAHYHQSLPALIRLVLAGHIDIVKLKSDAKVPHDPEQRPHDVIPGCRTLTPHGCIEKAKDLIDHGHNVSPSMFWQGFTPKERTLVEKRAQELRQFTGAVVVSDAADDVDMSDWEE